MSKLFYQKSITPNVYGVYLLSKPNRKWLGRLIRLEDGFYYYEPSKFLDSGGVWQGWILLDIGNKLKELNADWSKELDEAYRNSPPIDNLDPFNDLGF